MNAKKRFTKLVAGACIEFSEWGIVGLVGALVGLPHKTVRRIIQQEPRSRRIVCPAKDVAAGTTHGEHSEGPTSADHPKAVLGAGQISRHALNERLASGTPVFEASAPAGGTRQCISDDLGIAMRVSSFATMILSSGLPKETFPFIMDSIDANFPGSVGDINLSTNFLDGFRRSLLQTIDSLQTSAFHARLPALRIPSDFYRAFDTVTPKSGEPLLVAVDVITDPISGRPQPLQSSSCLRR